MARVRVLESVPKGSIGAFKRVSVMGSSKR